MVGFWVRTVTDERYSGKGNAMKVATEEDDDGSETRSARLGLWEWVALPDLGLSCLEACIEDTARRGRLECDDILSLPVSGQPGVRFRIHPLVDDARTYMLAEVVLAEPLTLVAAPVIQTRLALGVHIWSITLELVPRGSGGQPLILGARSLGHGFTIDPTAEGLAGLPACIWSGGSASRSESECREPLADRLRASGDPAGRPGDERTVA
jgi:hypothetical protein